MGWPREINLVGKELLPSFRALVFALRVGSFVASGDWCADRAMVITT